MYDMIKTPNNEFISIVVHQMFHLVHKPVCDHLFVRAACSDRTEERQHDRTHRENPQGTGVTHHIWSRIFFPLSSTVLILKSTPNREIRNRHEVVFRSCSFSE